MLMLLSIIFGMLLVLPAGGSYGNLAACRVRWSGLFLLGVAVQFGVTPLLRDSPLELDPAHAWTIGALIIVTACLANGRNSGFVVAGLGVIMNVFVIVANGGMPVAVEALETIGAHPGVAIQSGTIYHLIDEATHMRVLSDVVPFPGPVGVRSVASLGDLLICVGIVVATLRMASVKAVADIRTQDLCRNRSAE